MLLCGGIRLQAWGVPLPEAYRAAKAALESGDAGKAAGILEPRLAEAQGGQRGAFLFTLGVAQMKLGRNAEAERSLAEAKTLMAGSPKLAEAWALLADAQAAQAKSSEAAQSYGEAAKASADPGSALAKYAAARIAELAAADLLAKGDVLSAVGRLSSAAEISAERADAVRAQLGEIAGNRRLRGEATAAAVFSLGEIERRAGNLPEAIAYYQRVFVSWLKYPAWVARSYLGASECFDRLGKRREAVAHLQEMLRKADRFAGLPELAEARRRLLAWKPKKP